MLNEYHVTVLMCGYQRHSCSMKNKARNYQRTSKTNAKTHDQAVARRGIIKKVPDWSLGRGTGCPEVLRGFSQTLQATP
jgi:hypothetical protein